MDSRGPTPQSGDVREQLKRICASEVFCSAPQISRLLTFLVESTLEAKPLKESIIGVSFFNRAPGYDPQKEPVVRAEARRLRLKLGEYYAQEHSTAAVLIEIPRGCYQAKFTFRRVAPAEIESGPAPELPPASPPPVVRRFMDARVIGLAAVLLIPAAIWVLSTRLHSMGQRSVAVFRMRNLQDSADTAWLGNALSEMIATQLSSTEKLRSIPLDDAARTRLGFAQPDAVSLKPAELARIRQTFGADLVVAGSYASVGTGGSKTYRIDAQMYETRTGQVVGSVTETGEEPTLFAMVSRVASRIGRQVGVETISTEGNGPFQTRNLSKVDLAKTLCWKADFMPAGTDKEALYRQALELGRKESHGAWEIAALTGLARISTGRRDFENAASYYRQSYEVSRTYNGPDHAATVEAEIGWARARTRLKQGQEAVLQIREAVPRAQRSLAADPDRLWNILHDAIHGCNEAKAFPDAEKFTVEALALNERMHLPSTSERWGMLYWDLGRAKRGQKQYAQALAAFDKAKNDFKQFTDNRVEQVSADIELTKAAIREQAGKSR